MLALRFGVGLVAASFVCWIGVLGAPIIGRLSSVRTGVTVAGTSFVIAEVTFWIGLALMGRDSWAAAKKHGWRRLSGVLWEMLLHGAPSSKADSSNQERNTPREDTQDRHGPNP